MLQASHSLPPSPDLFCITTRSGGLRGRGGESPSLGQSSCLSLSVWIFLSLSLSLSLFLSLSRSLALPLPLSCSPSPFFSFSLSLSPSLSVSDQSLSYSLSAQTLTFPEGLQSIAAMAHTAYCHRVTGNKLSQKKGPTF